jgi:hypothetical protein
MPFERPFIKYHPLEFFPTAEKYGRTVLQSTEESQGKMQRPDIGRRADTIEIP